MKRAILFAALFTMQGTAVAITHYLAVSLSAFLLTLFLQTVSFGATIYEFPVWEVGGSEHGIYSERPNPEFPTGLTEPINLFEFFDPGTATGEFLITDDAQIGTRDMHLESPTIAGDLTRSMHVEGTFDSVDIVYAVEFDPYTVEIAGEHYRSLAPRDGSETIFTAETGTLMENVQHPATITGSYSISGPTETMAGTFTIPVTAINPRDWQGPLSDGNRNTMAKIFRNTPSEWTMINQPVDYGYVELYPDTSHWSVPYDIAAGTVDGAEVLLSYTGSRVSADSTIVIPEPSGGVLLMVGLCCMGLARRARR